jgi:hypothetical protein
VGSTLNDRYGCGIVGVTSYNLVFARLTDLHAATRRVDDQGLTLGEGVQLDENSALRLGCDKLALIKCRNVELGRLIKHDAIVSHIDCRGGLWLGPETLAVGDRVVKCSRRPLGFAGGVE